MTTNSGNDEVVWGRLAVCISHQGKRCLPSKAFADIMARRRFDLTVVGCKVTGSWHIEQTSRTADLAIPRQRNAT